MWIMREISEGLKTVFFKCGGTRIVGPELLGERQLNEIIEFLIQNPSKRAIEGQAISALTRAGENWRLRGRPEGCVIFGNNFSAIHERGNKSRHTFTDEDVKTIAVALDAKVSGILFANPGKLSFEVYTWHRENPEFYPEWVGRIQDKSLKHESSEIKLYRS